MIQIQTQDFDVGQVVRELKDATGDIGAIVSFVGLVREFSDQKSITSMTLEHYPGMTEAALQKIENDATLRWNLLGTTIIHRVGQLKAGENIVLVATAAAHRKDAFESAQYIMDFLKTEAPLWKKEHTDKESYWVESKGSDLKARNRW